MDARRTSARGAASQRHPFAAPPLRPELAAALVPGATFERTFTEQITYTATVEAVDRRPSATWVDVRWEEVEPGSGAGRERLQADSLAEDHIALTAQEVRPPAPPSPRAVQNEYEEQRAAAIRRNNEMLAQLGVTKAKAAARRAEEAEAASAQRTARRNREETRCTTTAVNLAADPSQLTKNQKRKRRRKLKQAAAAGDSAEAARQALEHARGQPPLRISLVLRAHDLSGGTVAEGRGADDSVVPARIVPAGRDDALVLTHLPGVLYAEPGTPCRDARHTVTGTGVDRKPEAVHVVPVPANVFAGGGSQYHTRTPKAIAILRAVDEDSVAALGNGHDATYKLWSARHRSRSR